MRSSPASICAEPAFSRRRRCNAPLPAFNECPSIRKSGWYHGRVMPFVPISAKAEGRKAFCFRPGMNITFQRRIDMKEKLQGILQSAKEQLAAAADARALDEARVKFLGKKGELTALLKGMKDVAAESSASSSTTFALRSRPSSTSRKSCSSRQRSKRNSLPRPSTLPCRVRTLSSAKSIR